MGRILNGKVVEHIVFALGGEYTQVSRIMRAAVNVSAIKVPLGVANQASVRVVILSNGRELVKRFQFSGLIDPEYGAATEPRVTAKIAAAVGYANHVPSAVVSHAVGKSPV